MNRILLFLASTLLFPQLSFSADECIVHAPHDSVSYVLVDRTDKLQDISKLNSFLEGIRESVPQGERVVIATSSDTTSNTNIILDLVSPKESVWESTMKIRAAQNKLKRCFAETEKALGENQQETKYSALLETINYFAKLIGGDSSKGNKRLFIFSDMVQNSKSITFWPQKAVDSDSAIKLAKKNGLIPILKNVEVIVAGAGIGVEDIKAKDIEKFWSTFFEISEANLSSYGPILDIH